MGFQVQFAVLSWIRSPRHSRHNMKMYGDKGSPWRIPWEGLKAGSLPPLKISKTEVEEIQSMMMAMTFEGKLKYTRTSLIKLHSRQSKAFSMPSCHSSLFLFYIEWRISWAIIILSSPFLPGMNAAWSGEISCCIWGPYSIDNDLWNRFVDRSTKINWSKITPKLSSHLFSG